MPTLLATQRGDKQKYLIAATLLFTQEGMPTVTWGEEYGRSGKAWPENRENMFWPNSADLPNATWQADPEIYKQFKRLIALRNSEEDLRSDAYEVLHFTNDLLALLRGNNTLVVINRADSPSEWNDKLGTPDSWEMLFSSTGTSFDNSILIGGVEARIFKKKLP